MLLLCFLSRFPPTSHRDAISLPRLTAFSISYLGLAHLCSVTDVNDALACAAEVNSGEREVKSVLMRESETPSSDRFTEPEDS